jgi:hypothetical protein
LPEPFALVFESDERKAQAVLSLWCESQVRDASVRARSGAFEQSCVLGAVDEFGDCALCELEPLREVGDGRLLAAVRGALDHQQQLVALRRQPRLPRDPLTLTRELAQRRTKLRGGNHALDRKRARTRLHRDPILKPHQPQRSAEVPETRVTARSWVRSLLAVLVSFAPAVELVDLDVEEAACLVGGPSEFERHLVHDAEDVSARLSWRA